jgi:hypothetical protein
MKNSLIEKFYLWIPRLAQTVGTLGTMQKTSIKSQGAKQKINPN